MHILWLGKVPYPDALQLQNELVAARRDGLIGDVVLLLTHPPTITLGRGAHLAHILADSERLRALGVETHAVGRGGDVTYHGPTQLIGYAIVDLARLRPDIHWFLRTLEASLIEALEHWGVRARRFPPHTGVWTDAGKIAAIGVQVRRWITSHGFALNVEPDLSGFDLIVPCGIRDYGVTSLSACTGRPMSVAETIAPVARALAHCLAPASEAAFDWSPLSDLSRKILAAGVDPTA